MPHLTGFSFCSLLAKKSCQSGKTSLFVVVLFGVVIAGAMVMSNGILPQVPLNPDDRIIFDIGGVEGDRESKDTIQLKTLKIKCDRSLLSANFVIDTSGSMNQGQRLQNVRAAIAQFTEEYPDTGLVSLYTFNETVNEDVPPSPLLMAGDQLSAAAASIQPRAGTHTRDAFSYIEQRLDALQNEYPTYDHNIIFISDGIPETTANNTRLGKTHQYDPSQDPTQVINRLKQQGFTVYTVALSDTLDPVQDTKHQEIMAAAASDREGYIPIYDDDVTTVIGRINKKMCDNV